MTAPIAVVSTGYKARQWRERHISSVNCQTVQPDRGHFYSDAAEPALRRFETCAENLYEVIRGLAPDTIVVWLDADDWLAHSNALARVAEAYEDPNVWLTFGQFEMWPQRNPGWASPYSLATVLSNDFRNDVWRATHLKTFRAGLFHQIGMCDLLVENGPVLDWRTRAVDMAIMFPLLEMAGARHAFIPDVLCVYNVANPESAHNKGERAVEDTAALEVRAMPKYAMLEYGFRPW